MVRMTRLTQLGHEPCICAVHYWIMNSRNGHLTGLVVDAYLSRKIQKSGVAGHANAGLTLSALASINSGRGGTGREKVTHDRNADHLCFDFDRPGQPAGAKRARSRASPGTPCGPQAFPRLDAPPAT